MSGAINHSTGEGLLFALAGKAHLVKKLKYEGRGRTKKKSERLTLRQKIEASRKRREATP